MLLQQWPVDGLGEPFPRRYDWFFQTAYQHERNYIFLIALYDAIDAMGKGITSFFVQSQHPSLFLCSLPSILLSNVTVTFIPRAFLLLSLTIELFPRDIDCVTFIYTRPCRQLRAKGGSIFSRHTWRTAEAPQKRPSRTAQRRLGQARKKQ